MVYFFIKFSTDERLDHIFDTYYLEESLRLLSINVLSVILTPEVRKANWPNFIAKLRDGS